MCICIGMWGWIEAMLLSGVLSNLPVFFVLVQAGKILNFLKANLTCAKKINKIVCN